MNKIAILLLGFHFLTNSMYGQKLLYPDVYMVSFSDKAYNSCSLSQPINFLSKRALERRIKQNISLNEVDLPVSQRYVDSLESLGFQVIKTSKWLNSVCVKIADTSVFSVLRKQSFIKRSTTRTEALKLGLACQKLDIKTSLPIDAFYGLSVYQAALHNGLYLHNLGYKGKEMLVAVFDGGFLNVQEMSVFDSLVSEGRILMSRNLVKGGNDVYCYSSHGSMVLSTMAANLSGIMVGTAPNAAYALFVSEDVNSEYPIEEFNWAIAAEIADSLGADVINSSLGYTQFDNASLSYTYSDMDGHTSIASKAASVAASKGLLIVVSAGNEGNNTWHYIGAPADADSVLTVGAVDTSGNIASFSSYGPSADSRVKPDVLAVGYQSVVANIDNGVGLGNGTSFSSPILAGLVSCLWQAFPNRTNIELIQAVRESASLYNSPGPQTGYGIPDFEKAYSLLSALDSSSSGIFVKCYPNPFSCLLNVFIPMAGNKKVNIKILTISGNVVFKTQQTISHLHTVELTGLGGLPTGVYVLWIGAEGINYKTKVVKWQ